MEVVNIGFLVCVQYDSVLTFEVTPCSKKFVGKMVAIIKCHFDDEGYLLCCNMFSMLGMLNSFYLTDSLVMCCYFNLDILVPSTRWILRCKNTSSCLRRDLKSAHLSHPHGSKLMEMLRKMRYLLVLLMLESVQNLWMDPTYAFNSAKRASMS